MKKPVGRAGGWLPWPQRKGAAWSGKRVMSAWQSPGIDRKKRERMVRRTGSDTCAADPEDRHLAFELNLARRMKITARTMVVSGKNRPDVVPAESLRAMATTLTRMASVPPT